MLIAGQPGRPESTVTTISAKDRLRERFRKLMNLNPDVSTAALQELFAHAEKTAPAAFAEFAALAEQIIAAYADSAVKRTESAVLTHYLAAIEQTAKALEQQGDITGGRAGDSPGEAPSMALVSRYAFSALEWFQLLEQTAVPEELADAVDAAEVRSRMTDSVLPPVFRALHLIDSPQAFTWELQFLEEHRGNLDFDVVRDLLRAWQTVDQLPADAVAWTAEWSLDINLAFVRPVVVAEADRLLRRQALARWKSRRAARHPSLQHLRNIISRRSHQEERLSRWLRGSVADLGEAVSAFMTAAQGSGKTAGQTPHHARRLVQTLTAIADLFEPVLLTADLLFHAPDGGYQLALMFFGITMADIESWRRVWEGQAADIIRRLLLQDLRQHHQPLATIREFCLGDALLFQQLANQLDLISKQFDSVELRENVIAELAANYASFRETEFLEREIAKRYRNLMRLLHADFLRRVLDPEQLQMVQDLVILNDLYALAGDARRYLTRRRDLTRSVAEMLSSEADFSRALRQHRIRLIRKLTTTAAS
jgi:hypothetical protein